MFIYKNYILIFILFLTSCGNRNVKIENTNKNGIYEFDIKNEIGKIKISLDTFTINDIAKGIHLIPLETKEQALLGTFNLRLNKIDNNYIVSSGILNNYSVIRFDTSGNFIENLTCRGNGHNEVPRIISVLGNDSLKQLCIKGNTQIIVNDFKNSNKYSVKYDNYFFQIELLNSGDYVCCPISGAGSNRIPYICYMNKEGIFVDSLKYSDNNDKSIIDRMDMPEMVYESYALYPTYYGDVLFKDVFNDTIYIIKERGLIKPYVVLKRGEFAPTIEDFENISDNSSRIFIRNMCESENLFMFKYIYNNEVYSSMWDKRDGKEISRIKTDRASTEANSYKLFCKYRLPNKEIIIINVVGAEKNKIYALLTPEQARNFISDIDTYSNPVIMVIDLL